MFAPSINDAKNELAAGYQTIVSLDGFAISTSNLTVVQLPDEPDWLGPVREETAVLRQLAGDWILARPDIWSKVLTSYLDYIPTFQSVAATAATGPLSTEQWTELLSDVLLPQVQASQAMVQQAITATEALRGKFSAQLPIIDKEIQAGWVDLGHEAQAMLKLAGALGALWQQAADHGAEITADGLDGGEAYLETMVETIYSVAAGTAEAAIPIVGVITIVFTIGKTFFDIIEDDNKLIETMQEINAIQAELDAAAVQLALTKGTLQILYQLEISYLKTRDALPGIAEMWKDQESAIQDAINAIAAGAQPDQYLDILTIPTALTNWNAIADFVTSITHTDFDFGPPVTVDIAKATITEQTESTAPQPSFA